MKTLITACLALAAFGCDDQDKVPEDLMVAPIPDLSAAAATRMATLTGAQEVPAVATAYSGTSMVTIDSARTIITLTTTHTIPPGQTTAAHIHVGAPGVAGPIIF